MLMILMILAVIARFATNFSNWKIALALTFVFLLFAHLADNAPSNAHLVFAILFSPAAYIILHAFLIPLAWLRSKIIRPSFGRN